MKPKRRGQSAWRISTVPAKSGGKRNAAVCGAPAAADPPERHVEDVSQRLGIRGCRGWSFGHSRAPGAAARRGQSAFLLEECLVYLVVSSILLGLAFAAFYRVLDNAKSVRRNAADISRVLQAGERWRTDIHQATGPLELVSLEGAIEQALHVPQRSGEVVYFFGETNVLRRAGPDAPWTEILAAVKRSRIIRDARDRVVAWRWEVELIPGRKEPLVRPLFTFQAAARNLEKP